MGEVLSIRISKELKRAMKEVNIDWRREIEAFIKRRIREYLKERYLREARLLRMKIPKATVSSGDLIREDRDER